MFQIFKTLLQAPFALVVAFYEWGWESLAALMSRLARLPVWARAEAIIRGLPPWAALLMFLTPTAVLLPLKFVALYLLAHGQKLLGVAVFFAAKVVGTALVARLFQLTHPALMRIGLFARLYNRFKPWKDLWLGRLRASYAWRWGRVMKALTKRGVARAMRPLRAMWATLRQRVKK